MSYAVELRQQGEQDGLLAARHDSHELGKPESFEQGDAILIRAGSAPCFHGGTPKAPEPDFDHLAEGLGEERVAARGTTKPVRKG